LRDLGVHHLKGLRHPEPIFQVVAPDLPSDFGAPAARAAGQGNLPPEPTPFIGRAQEVEAVRLCLSDPTVHLLTLTGSGGTGKTRLALQAAAALSEEYPDGAWFVDLTPIHDVNLVSTAIIQTLSEGEVRSEASTQRLIRYLGDKKLLLLLDNFEQVLGANVLLSDILRGAPQVKLLVTSRSRLHLAAEHELAIPPLALPDLHQLPSLEQLLQIDSVQLFVSRIRAVVPDYQLTTADAHPVAAICVALDGLPLAIELAAARSKLLPPRALLARLDQRLRLLTRGSHDLARRHQTLRSTIDWSYMLLSAAEQTLFRRLGVFVGGWTIEAAEAVCGSISDDSPESAGDILEGLEFLLDHSLVRRAPWGTGPAPEQPRLQMLETLREYALERLASSGEAEVMRRHHCTYYLGVAETATPKLISPEWRTWQRRLEAELGNLQAALEWTLGSGEIELALRLGTALIGTWWAPATVLRKWYEHAQEWARTSVDTLPPRAKALFFRHIGRYAFWHAEYAPALTYIEQALAYFQALGDAPDIAKTLEYRADVARDTDDFTHAEQLYADCLAR
jgi:predicted ATPase